jgi:hypothetical protein
MGWTWKLNKYKDSQGLVDNYQLIAKYETETTVTIEVFYNEYKKRTSAKLYYLVFLENEDFIETVYLSEKPVAITGHRLGEGDSLKVFNKIFASYKKEAKGYIQADYDDYKTHFESMLKVL